MSLIDTLMSSRDELAQARCLRALAWLLRYPDAEMREALPVLQQALSDNGALSAARRQGLGRLMNGLMSLDPFQIESEYVELFDSGRSTSLHLFEHVHGDSRDRGQAMVDLLKTYEQSGMHVHPDLAGKELPDYLPLVLEFASTLGGAQRREFVGEFAHILNALYAALLKRRSLYAHIPAAVLESCGLDIAPTEVPEDEALDEAWAEPEAFGGCSSRGQQRPDQAQPIRIVRKQAAGASQPI
ncbi:MAG: nitrate reductase molybdenum cofactor assembly chaperone [Aquabacterium sp.]